MHAYVLFFGIIMSVLSMYLFIKCVKNENPRPKIYQLLIFYYRYI